MADNYAELRGSALAYVRAFLNGSDPLKQHRAARLAYAYLFKEWDRYQEVLDSRASEATKTWVLLTLSTLDSDEAATTIQRSLHGMDSLPLAFLTERTLKRMRGSKAIEVRRELEQADIPEMIRRELKPRSKHKRKYRSA